MFQKFAKFFRSLFSENHLCIEWTSSETCISANRPVVTSLSGRKAANSGFYSKHPNSFWINKKLESIIWSEDDRIKTLTFYCSTLYVLWVVSCQKLFAADGNEACGQSKYSEHQSQVGHSNTSAAERLHPEVSGTTAAVFDCLPSPKLNKGKKKHILSVVFIRPFPIAAFPTAAKFADGPNPHNCSF